jgi:hypothetical protein
MNTDCQAHLKQNPTAFPHRSDGGVVNFVYFQFSSARLEAKEKHSKMSAIAATQALRLSLSLQSRESMPISSS